MNEKMDLFVSESISRELRQLSDMPSQSLVYQRVMQGVCEAKREKRSRSTAVWQSLAVAASFALVIASGVALGKHYRTPVYEYNTLIINDEYIENLHIFENIVNNDKNE